jgi:hypothetical protein
MREVSSGGRGENERENVNVVAATMRRGEGTESTRGDWGRRKMDSGKSKTKGKQGVYEQGLY